MRPRYIQSVQSGVGGRRVTNPWPRRIILLLALALLAGGLFLRARNGASKRDEGGESEVPGETAAPPMESPSMVGAEPLAAPAPPSEAARPVSPLIPAEQAVDTTRVLDTAQAELDKREYVAARDLASDVVESGIPVNSQLWRRAANILSAANTAIFTTDVPTPEKEMYTIKTGDSLDRIARRFDTTVQAIKRANNLSGETIFPGNQLRIYRGEWSIRVNKSDFLLYLFDRGKLFKIYGIGIGAQDRTPVGTFEISEKVPEPDWEYRGRRYPYGSPENILGTRWMRIVPIGDTDKNLQGYGIHGTHDPDSIGRAESNGCVRMRNPEVEELFDIIPTYRPAGGYVPVVIED